ncbi:MAG: fructose-6-phosphate aldolase, partial [Eubacteriaceae bacterium]|nr:fructose-6-phosphate aldolase [Eubacteriaceae bacterium]
MRILLDTANLDEIIKCADIFYLDGVTTNPSIIAKENVDFIPHMRKLAEALGQERELFVQVIATDYEGIIDDANLLNELITANLYIKIPVTLNGLKAIKTLSAKGMKIAATSIINSQQGLLAAKAGAKYLIPYVNRVDNIMGDGVNVVGELVRMIERYKLNSEVIAASFKNIQQIHNCALENVQAVTISADLLYRLAANHLTEFSVDE